MERGVIDRFEGEWVVIEIEGTTRDFPRTSLPKEMKVGDAVIIDNGSIRPNNQESAKRKSDMEQLMDELFE